MISRYVYPEMAKLWSEEEKFTSWLAVEIAVCKAWKKAGKIPSEAMRRIEKKAEFSLIQIEEFEKDTRHDVIAFIQSVSQYLQEDARYFHYGLTSSDVVDTALALRMKKGLDLILHSAQQLLQELQKKALKYKNTIMIGRTHGIHAEPITFGLKLLLFHQELKRNITRLEKAKENISFGKISGAVGTLSHTPVEVEIETMKFLGLNIEPVSSQVIQRDRHAEVMSALALLSAGMEKIATEFRNLQRTDINEVQEPFMRGQKGSSAMPHKRNPVNCEQISGLSRIVRSNLQAALENISLWHERDISHSSVERIIIPDSFCLCHYIIEKMRFIISCLKVNPENMRKNLKKTNGLIFSQKILLYLIEKGLSRKEAYDIVQRNAFLTWENEKAFQDNLSRDKKFKTICNGNELSDLMSYESYLCNIDVIFSRALDDKRK